MGCGKSQAEFTKVIEQGERLKKELNDEILKKDQKIKTAEQKIDLIEKEKKDLENKSEEDLKNKENILQRLNEENQKLKENIENQVKFRVDRILLGNEEEFNEVVLKIKKTDESIINENKCLANLDQELMQIRDKCAERLKNIDNRKEELKRICEESDRLQNEINQKQIEFRRIKDDLDSKSNELNDKNQELTSVDDEISQALESIRRKNDELDAKKAENSNLSQTLNEKIDECNEIKKTFAFLALSRNSKTIKFKEHQNFLEKMRAEFVILQNSINTEQNELSSKQNQINEIEKENLDCTYKLGIVKHDLNELNLELDSKTQKKQNDLNQLNQITQDIDLTNAEIQINFQTLSNKKDELDQLNVKLNKTQSKIISSTQLISEKSSELSKVKENLEETSKSIDLSNNQLILNTQTLHKLSEDVKSLQSSISDLESTLKSKQDQSRDLSGSLLVIESEIQSKTLALSKLSETLSEINGNLKCKQETLSTVSYKTQKQFSYFYETEGKYVAPTSLMLKPVVLETKGKFRECNLDSGHVLVFNPSTIFKLYSKFSSFNPVCSVCDCSSRNFMWICENCDLIVCFGCKPLEYFCAEGHRLVDDFKLKVFKCWACELEKVSCSRECKECDLRVCGECAFLNSKVKVVCDNMHKLVKGRVERNCFVCKNSEAIFSCECFAMCQDCYLYLRTETHINPAITCSNKHLLHIYQNTMHCQENCGICNQNNTAMYYCKDCNVFICDSCSNSALETILSSPYCDNSHKLTWNPEAGKYSNNSYQGFGKFECEICDMSYDFLNIPNRV